MVECWAAQSVATLALLRAVKMAARSVDYSADQWGAPTVAVKVGQSAGHLDYLKVGQKAEKWVGAKVAAMAGGWVGM